MATRSGSTYRVWIRPFRHWWKPLAWIWGALILGVIVNDGSSWLITKNFDISGTPLGWGIDHPWIMLPSLSLLGLLTGISGLAVFQERAVSPASPLTLTPKQRLQFIRGFQQEYPNRQTSSLQGQVTLDLHLQGRTDVIASSASLVFHHLETGEASSLLAGTSIIQAYDHAQRGLLILGAPGSGKTTLLLELARELLQRAENDSDQPLAIILNLSSWARTRLPLAQWLRKQCALVYGMSERLTATLIEQEQVQFLLDGLNEMEPSARTACIEAINTYRQAHLVPLVVCSRSQEYESQPARLILPAAVEIQPLKLEQILQVLKQAGKSFAALRAALRNNASLRDLLTTPLWLSIMTRTYRDKTVKDLPQLGTAEQQKQRVLERYVECILKQRTTKRHYTLKQTQRWLIWLAQQMQKRSQTEFFLEQMQPDWLPSKRSRMAYRAVVVLVFVLISIPILGLAGVLNSQPFNPFQAYDWGLGLALGLVEGLMFGLFFGLLFALGKWSTRGLGGLKEEIQPMEIAWSRQNILLYSVIGLIVGLGLFLLVLQQVGLGVGLPRILFNLLIYELFGGLFGGALGIMYGGIAAKRLEKHNLIRPNQGIRRSGQNAALGGLAVNLLVGLAFLVFYESFSGLSLGSLFGLMVGLVFGGGACIQHFVLRWILKQKGSLPWRYARFLEEVKGYALLQRVGGGYQFVHLLLQDYFASLNMEAVLEQGTGQAQSPE